MLKGFLMTLRLLWLIALATGILFYFRPATLPVNVHMWLGFAITGIMIVIGVKGLRVVPTLAIVTILWAFLLPFIGILQLTRIGHPDLLYVQITHIVIGIGAIALGEIVGGRTSRAAA